MTFVAMVFGWFIGGGSMVMWVRWWLWKMLGGRRFGGGREGKNILSIQVSYGLKEVKAFLLIYSQKEKGTIIPTINPCYCHYSCG